MGGRLSKADRLAKRRSAMIDKQIEEDFRQRKRECTVLLLGSSGSGKSTIMRQMVIANQGGFSACERVEWRPVIYWNVLESAQAVLVYLRKIGLGSHCEVLNQALLNNLPKFQLEMLKGPAVLPAEITEAIHWVWKTTGDHFGDLYPQDSTRYFLDEVLRIGQGGYLPSETDVLKARWKASAIQEVKLTMGLLSIRMVGVSGQFSERKRWIHCFESATSIVFCTAMSDYDQVLLAERTQNRMLESLVLFESVINSRWFRRTSIVLLLTKIDVFKNKLPKVPLEFYFPEYTGGSDINKAVKFILWKFMQANRARLSVYPHIASLHDLTTIRLIFAAVKETILQNALKDSGIL
ncbi:unnamed protein product [Cyclocybe aegerita]|uniref:Uncharacterized protein n=1 Tax=Cyclocybe aegerita TaxID=1973307 RepID=A0A8S0WB90_CYCAE|nr:unnamed protein product [Cyclocybe aegerita]